MKFFLMSLNFFLVKKKKEEKIVTFFFSLFLKINML